MNLEQLVRRPLAAALLGAATVAVPATALYLHGATPQAAEVEAPPTAGASVASPAMPGRVSGAAALPDFRGLVERNGASVVNISVSGTARTPVQMPGIPGFGPDDPFSQFFRGFSLPRGEMPMRGEGSGFIVSADGLILTNAHVVANADEVTVKLLDRREFEAKVLGSDPATDVAVLRIDARDLPAVRIGRPEELVVGQWVAAIGAPFGFDNSVTAGIVSAKGRNLPSDTYVPFIQTDVAVNPGNSGGPLFNLDGEVVGINSQIYSRSGGFQGVSFAIPIDIAMNVSRQLQAKGHVTRGRLGVGIQDLDQALASSFGLDAPRGALVSTVEKEGPAAKAGLQAGDVITSFDGRAVDTAGALPALVAATPPGKSVPVEVWRDRSQKTFQVLIAEMPQDEGVVAQSGAGQESGRLGLAVRPLSRAEAQQIDADGGLVVEQVHGAAEEAGIRPGDVVLSANGRSVRSVEELRAALSGSKDHVALLVQRGDGRLFVPVDLG